MHVNALEPLIIPFSLLDFLLTLLRAFLTDLLKF